MIYEQSLKGPSPRVRGKLRVKLIDPSVLGSIPARAGETGPVRWMGLSLRVHPRACGGNLNCLS